MTPLATRQLQNHHFQLNVSSPGEAPSVPPKRFSLAVTRFPSWLHSDLQAASTCSSRWRLQELCSDHLRRELHSSGAFASRRRQTDRLSRGGKSVEEIAGRRSVLTVRPADHREGRWPYVGKQTLKGETASFRKVRRQKGEETEGGGDRKVRRQKGKETEGGGDRKVRRQKGVETEGGGDRRGRRQKGEETERGGDRKGQRQKGAETERGGDRKVRRQKGAETERGGDRKGRRQKGEGDRKGRRQKGAETERGGDRKTEGRGGTPGRSPGTWGLACRSAGLDLGPKMHDEWLHHTDLHHAPRTETHFESMPVSGGRTKIRSGFAGKGPSRASGALKERRAAAASPSSSSRCGDSTGAGDRAPTSSGTKSS
ncbi:hypothetical protein EYF80_033704 [Liparis tanakae]|uniref:Uncharacterized protein n=1 Tax=Liparis tanakae TaxID=230148 RepID=A0A4Z2GTF5_9TELE|nr:hypothetical protein EYF80_033704 [Liparis tanakae]